MSNRIIATFFRLFGIEGLKDSEERYTRSVYISRLATAARKFRIANSIGDDAVKQSSFLEIQQIVRKYPDLLSDQSWRKILTQLRVLSLLEHSKTEIVHRLETHAF